jgi:hypothetical protein
MRRFSNVCPTVLGKGGLPNPRRASSATRGGCLAVVTEYPKPAWVDGGQSASIINVEWLEIENSSGGIPRRLRFSRAPPSSAWRKY